MKLTKSELVELIIQSEQHVRGRAVQLPVDGHDAVVVITN